MGCNDRTKHTVIVTAGAGQQVRPRGLGKPSQSLTQKATTVNISAEIILGIITGFGAVLSGAVGKMWVWFNAELRECKDDRKALHERVETMHNNIAEISTKVGRLEGLKEDK